MFPQTAAGHGMRLQGVGPHQHRGVSIGTGLSKTRLLSLKRYVTVEK